ncbi:MAG: nucleoside monophosphate kinase, partial [Candidatus Nanoarchaeia archaeon]|nr:nucleoside monophosphate kinase [Candidatus Nanoarchaeia archaeon]
MRIVIIGPPGSGKGAQSELLQSRLKLKHISSGELLRKEIRKKTVIGKKINSLLKRGSLAPDKVIDKIITKTIRGKNNFILDGYPRDLKQTKYLDKITKIDKVLLLKVPNSLIIKRLSSRRICKCGETFNLLTKKSKKKGICDKDNKKLYQRNDDKIDIIKKRLKIYKTK